MGGYIEDFILRRTIGVIKGDSRSLDYILTHSSLIDILYSYAFEEHVGVGAVLEP